MKIALLGNCQLQQLGWVLKQFFEQQRLDFSIVWSDPIFAMGDINAPIVPLFDTLARADAIYGQYHDARWNALSTPRLSQLFKIKVVPTLESLASFPQMNYFSTGDLHFNLYTVDFRMLELYLHGVDVALAPSLYAAAGMDRAQRDLLIDNSAKKYKDLFDSGRSLFDYSSTYREAMAGETTGSATPFFVHNHPNNAQLQWLANQILLDAGCPRLVSLVNLQEILTDTQVPTLDAPHDDRYRLRATEIGLATACKVYYAFFSAYERDFLERELAASVYRTLVPRDTALPRPR